MSEIQFLIGRRPMRSYSPGALATIALWKSVPMVGTIVRRHRVPRPGGSDSQFYTVEDLNIGSELTVYARHFTLVDCDQFTRNFLTKLGVQVNHPQQIPGDPYSDQRRMVGRCLHLLYRLQSERTHS